MLIKDIKSEKFQNMQIKNHIFKLVDDLITFCARKSISCKS